MFWFLMKKTWTPTHAIFDVKGVKMKKKFLIVWLELFKLGFTFFYATFIHSHLKFKAHTQFLVFLYRVKTGEVK